MEKPSAILIAGPTASGKSALALALAEERGGAIINADSMQVYCELSVLTARPSPADESCAPHLLYGHVPGREAYSAALFMSEAAHAIASVRQRGLMPIIVGGTGLYFKALLEGLSPIPQIPGEIRDFWRQQADRVGAAALHATLKVRDPEMAARLRPTDPQRIVRALEVLEATGRSLAAWQAVPGTPVLAAEHCERLVVLPDRDALRRRCEERLDAMMEQGALEEVAALRDLKLDPDLPVMRALGVKPMLAHLAGASSRAEALEQSKAETRQYAKRQVTWLRRNMITWKWG
jgi:tRNA dimethylallyltransferase